MIATESLIYARYPQFYDQVEDMWGMLWMV